MNPRFQQTCEAPDSLLAKDRSRLESQNIKIRNQWQSMASQRKDWGISLFGNWKEQGQRSRQRTKGPSKGDPQKSTVSRPLVDGPIKVTKQWSDLLKRRFD
jgi:hypothetical protein